MNRIMLNNRILKFFEVAKAVSRTSEYPRVKIGCCIVKKNKILAVGVNLLKSHPIQKAFNEFRGLDTNKIHNNIHAELDAVLKVRHKEDLEGADIYLYREDSRGIRRICKPCPACMSMLKLYKIKTIYYTDGDDYHIGYL